MKFSDWFEINMGQSPEGYLVYQEKVGLPLLNGPSEFTDNYPIPVQYTSEQKKIAESEDLLFCVRGSTTGRMNWADQRYVIGRGLASIRSKLDRDLIHFGRAILDLKLPELLAGATGSTFPNVSKDMIAGIEFPELDEYKAITISKFLKTVRDKIELNTQINTTLESLAKAIFKEWFIDFGPVKAKAEGKKPFGMDEETAALFPDGFEESGLGEIPRGWGISNYSSVMSQHKESITPKSFGLEECIHYSLPNFDSGKVAKLEKIAYIKSNKFRVPDSSILFSKLNPSTPRIWITSHLSSQNQMAVGSTEFVVINPISSECRWLTYCLLNESVFLDRMSQTATGTSNSHQRIKPEAIFETKWATPGIEILRAFNKIVTPFFELSLNNLIEIQNLSQTRDLLLPKLISGEIQLSEVVGD